MSYFLFLDDERKPNAVTWIELPPYPWTVIRDYDSFISIIKERGLPEFISFDHDLSVPHYVAFQEAMNKMLAGKKAYLDYGSFREMTGYHCAQWLVDYCDMQGLEVPPYAVHSMNMIGRDNIISLLESFKGRDRSR